MMSSRIMLYGMRTRGIIGLIRSLDCASCKESNPHDCLTFLRISNQIGIYHSVMIDPFAAYLAAVILMWVYTCHRALCTLKASVAWVGFRPAPTFTSRWIRL